MHGLMKGHQRRGDGRLERDTRLKREKRYLLTSPGRYCAGVLLYNTEPLHCGTNCAFAQKST
jgi:hypothetical protein